MTNHSISLNMREFECLIERAGLSRGEAFAVSRDLLQKDKTFHHSADLQDLWAFATKPTSSRVCSHTVFVGGWKRIGARIHTKASIARRGKRAAPYLRRSHFCPQALTQVGWNNFSTVAEPGSVKDTRMSGKAPSLFIDRYNLAHAKL